MIGDSNEEANFPHKLLTNRQVLSIHKSFADNSSADIKFSKTELSKMIQSRGFLVKLLGPLLKTELSLIKNIIKPVAKSVLVPLGLTAAASAADAGISNNEMEDLTKIVKSPEDSSLLSKGVTETVQNEVKEQKAGFLSMLLGTLGASLLGNISAGKGINKKGWGTKRAGEGIIVRVGYGNKKDF